MFRALRKDQNKTLKAEGIDIGRINEIRDLYFDYTSNPTHYLDTSSFESLYGGRISFALKPFSSVAKMEELGSGVFSTVYALSDTLALKINKSEDRSYNLFSEFCRDNYRHFSSLPRVLYCENWGNEIFAYVTERLELGTTSDREVISTIAGNIVRGMVHSDDIRDSRIMNVSAEFYETCDVLRQFYVSNRGIFTLDLHSDNVMFRGITPVITDPFC